ncbi:hypothetical protein Barb7_00130 [Bacteroidales bacterium Barb7]|nr:hypothetical protein Barb7_00130 [Bacteroidales bacterium Barb7]
MITICRIHYLVVLSGLHWRYHPQTPHSAALHVGLKSGVLSGFLCRHHLQTPHSAALHVGLKSIAPLGHLHNINE